MFSAARAFTTSLPRSVNWASGFGCTMCTPIRTSIKSSNSWPRARYCRILDIPFQHASARILKLMKRPAAAENTLERIAAWRRVVPDITIRSTFIVGFPGETDEDFEELLDWLRVAQLDRVGCFEYSPVEGAAANALKQTPVPPELKAERRARFMEAAAEISARRLKQKIGRKMPVLIDRIDRDARCRHRALRERRPGDRRHGTHRGRGQRRRSPRGGLLGRRADHRRGRL